MKLKERLQQLFQGRIDSKLLEKLPAGYSVIGDIAIFRYINEELNDYKEILGDFIIEIDPQVSVVVEQLDTTSPFRKPLISHIAGEFKTKTIHQEYNTKFHLDISKITFSTGNKGERERLINLVEDDEVICDMFACIGNLSLPIVVNNPTVQAYGIEWNKEAYDFLETNIRNNKVENRYYAIFGDNREKTPLNFATRVLMGFFRSDEIQFVNALEALKDKGWIHYHITTPRNNTNKPRRFITNMINRTGYGIEIKEIRRVKKISPRLSHICFDIYVEK